MNKVSPESMSGCFLWTACCKRTPSPNYMEPRFGFEGKTEAARRVSWMLFKGKIPDNMHVLHTCNNCYCVNPEHLYLGTHSENMQDMIASGRGRTKNQKMSGPDIFNAMAMKQQGSKIIDIAKKYDVSAKGLSRALNGTRWLGIFAKQEN
jgi:hypothetical protein